MKKIIFIGILILTLGFWIIQIPQVNAECLDCTYTSTYDECGYDLDAYHLGNIDKICIVGTVTEGNAWFSDKDPCINNAKTQACGEGKCPSFNYKNGATCQIVYADDLNCNEPKTATGIWDAGNSKCIQCGWWIGPDGIKRDNSEISVCGTTSGITYDPSTGKCNGLATLAFREICGASKECEGKSAGCAGASGFCDSNGIYNKCPGNDCLLGNCPDAVPQPPEPLIPTLPDTGFCKDVDYCADITVLNEGTKDADVQGCIKNGIHYCQDIMIDNKDCTKVAGTFSDYAPSEIPACPEKVESVDVECLGLPEDISEGIAQNYSNLLKQYGGGSAAYILPLIPKISAASIYNQIIQDVSAAAAPQCDISSVKWSTEEAWDGEEVTVTLNTNNCPEGTPVKFEIYEDRKCDFNIIEKSMGPDRCKRNGIVVAQGVEMGYGLSFDGSALVDTDYTYKIDKNNNAVYKWNVVWISKKWDTDRKGNDPQYYAVAYVKTPGVYPYVSQHTDKLLTVNTCVKKLEWSQTSAFDKDKVKMEVSTTKKCENKDIKLTICEDDWPDGSSDPYTYCEYPDSEIPLGGGPISTKLDGTSKSVEWTAKWVDDTDIGGGVVNVNPPEFYFGIQIPSIDSDYKAVSSNILTVSRCIMSAKWDRAKASVGEEVTLTVETTPDCAEKAVEITIFEEDPMTFDQTVATVTKSGDKIDKDGKFKVKWNAQLVDSDFVEMGSEEDYFTVRILVGGKTYDEKDSDIMNVYLCLKSAEWQPEKNAVQGDTVEMNAEVGGSCVNNNNNYNIQFFICEDDYFGLGTIIPGMTCATLGTEDDYVLMQGTYLGKQPLTKTKFQVPWSVIWTEDPGGDAVDEYYFVTQITDSANNVVDEMKSDLLFAHYCIKSAEWSAENVFKDDEVTMTIETSNSCSGKDVEFQIWQDDWTFVGGMFLQPSPDDDYMGTKTSKVNCVDNKCKAEAKWKAEWITDWPANPPEYYFKAIIKNAGKVDGRDIDDFIDSDQLIVNECWDNALILCQHTTEKGLIWTETTTDYMLIDASRYFQLAKKEFPEIDQTKHWLLDMDKYTIANGKTCMKDNISKYTIIDNEKYRDYIHNTYGNEEFYKKFKEMYGQDYADDLYCYKTVLKDTQWCQDMSREWYGLENNSLDVVNEKYLNEINKWNYYQDVDEMPSKDTFRDLQYKNSVIFEDVWTKVFTVTPLLNDTRNYLEWTKTGDSSAYAGWGFDRKSICKSSCDAATATNAASGCTEKSNECDNCEGGGCGDCRKAGGCSTNPDPKDCYKTCKVDGRSGYIVDADVTNAGVVYGIPGDCGGDGFTNYQCIWGYSCVDSTQHKCAKCPSSDYELLSLTMYDRQQYSSDDEPSYPKVYKCIMYGVIKGETKFSIKDATVPDGVQPVKTKIKDNVWTITHPAFSITETGNLKYEITNISLTKSGDVYNLTEFYKPDSSYNKLRFEIDADTNFAYTILPDAGKLQIEINHTYTTSYIKDTYYAACSYAACNCGCSGRSCGNPGGQYSYSSAGCGETSSWYSCGGCCYKCGEGSRGCGNYLSSSRKERTTEILTDSVNVSEHWGFPWIWNFATGGPVGTSPAVAYGKVFVSSNDKLYALDEFSGKKIWEFNIPYYSTESSPTAADSMVFVGSGNGILYAVDEKTGNLVWSYTIPSGMQINTKPAVDKGRVFFGSDDKKVYALNEDNGDKLWEFATNGVIKSSPTIAEGMVFFGSDDNKVYALDEFSGEKKWEYVTGDDVRSSPTVSDGVVFVGSDDGGIYALNVSKGNLIVYNGNLIWALFIRDAYGTIGKIRTKPAVQDYRVFFGTMNFKRLYAFDRYNLGNFIWSYGTTGDILSSPAVAYNRVFFGSNDHNFTALDGEDGDLDWIYDAGGAIQSSPAIDKGMVFFGSVNGQVYALSAGIFPAHQERGTKGGTTYKFGTGVAEDARIKIEGNIDRYSTGTGFYGETVIGEINITIDPDILGSFVLSAECAFLIYTSQIYPAEHKLTAKESSAGPIGKSYGFNESYGYENSEFGYLEQCRKTCPLACNCYKEDGSFDRLLPNCLGFSEEGESTNNLRTDCACLPDWCYPEQCKSTRTFHEDEGSYIANGDFENGLNSWVVVSGIATQEPGGVSGYRLRLNPFCSGEITSVTSNAYDDNLDQNEIDFTVTFKNTGITACDYRVYVYSGSTLLDKEPDFSWVTVPPGATFIKTLTTNLDPFVSLADIATQYTVQLKAKKGSLENWVDYFTNCCGGCAKTCVPDGPLDWDPPAGYTCCGGCYLSSSSYFTCGAEIDNDIYQNIPSLSTNPANQICLNYWINHNNPGSFKLTAVVDGTPNEFTVYDGAPSCGIPAGWSKFCTPAINGKLSQVGLKSDIEVFVDNVNLGKYYDFVDLKTFSLEDVEIMDEKLSPKDSFGGISFDDITHENNTYSLRFSTTQLPYTVFEDANITLITNFRNITVKLFPASADIRENPYVNVKLKKPTMIFVTEIVPGKFNLKPGTQVTIHLLVIDLETNNPLPNGKVIAIDECGNEETLITDSNGETTFTTIVQNMGNCANKIRFVFTGTII